MKMKRMVCMVVIACMVLGTAFAQQKKAATKKNAIGMDVFRLFDGFINSDSDSDLMIIALAFNYERLVSPHVSIGPDIDFYYFKAGSDASAVYFGLSLEGRYYPQSDSFEKFFLGTTLGFNMLSADGSTKPENGGFMGLTVSLNTGYKVLFKSLYLEPSLAYRISKASMGMNPNGWNCGMRLGFAF